MVSRRVLLGALASGLAATPLAAFAEGDDHHAAAPRKVAPRPRAPMAAQTAAPAPGPVRSTVNEYPKPMETEPEEVFVNPDEALGRLKHGNAIFARGGASMALPSWTRINELAAGQKPFAVIVGCSDSRVPPELVFDCSLGELFVVRTAGSTVSREGLGSILYAVEHLGAPLIVVLGHTKCGAVGAAVDVATKHAHLHGALFDMALPILPAVLEAEESHPADLQDAAIRRNAINIAERLRTADEAFTTRIAANRLKVVSAVYSLQSGQVEFMG
ncbi:carbonic anhydrase [Caulobacter sp.]|uniref:carbonic anhydrase n=1 Tax=Caulobacter sp. TaxID=78 RepID=UPI003BACC92A